MPRATVTSKGQITIPVRVREALGVNSGDRIDFVEIAEKQFAIIPVTGSVRELKGLFRDKTRRTVSIEEMNQAIVKGASRSR